MLTETLPPGTPARSAIATTDPGALLPSSYTFGAGDAGTYSFNATLMAVGTQTISIKDTAVANINGSVSVSVNPGSAANVFVKEDTTTEGNWQGTYGTQGYDIIGNASSLPSYATVTPSGEASGTWTTSTTDPRALEDATGTSRVAGFMVAPEQLHVEREHDRRPDARSDAVLPRLGQHNPQRDRANQQRRHGAVLSTETVFSFHSGEYLQYAVSGNVLITITRVTGANAVLSGLFFDSTAARVHSHHIGSSLNPSTYGQSVTFTATVSDTSGVVPTGSVEFYDGSTDLGPGSALSGSGNSATSTFTTSTLTAGTHSSITAIYTPAGNFVGGSGSMSQTVNPQGPDDHRHGREQGLRRHHHGDGHPRG